MGVARCTSLFYIHLKPLPLLMCDDVMCLMQDWPPRFDSYLNLKYFWFVFVFLNSIWIVVPLYHYYNAYLELERLFQGKRLLQGKKKTS